MMGGVTEEEARIRAYLERTPRSGFLADVLRLYETEQQSNPTNPATSLSRRLGVNYGTLVGWVQQARKLASPTSVRT